MLTLTTLNTFIDSVTNQIQATLKARLERKLASLSTVTKKDEYLTFIHQYFEGMSTTTKTSHTELASYTPRVTQAQAKARTPKEMEAFTSRVITEIDKIQATKLYLIGAKKSIIAALNAPEGGKNPLSDLSEKFRYIINYFLSFSITTESIQVAALYALIRYLLENMDSRDPRATYDRIEDLIKSLPKDHFKEFIIAAQNAFFIHIQSLENAIKNATSDTLTVPMDKCKSNINALLLAILAKKLETDVKAALSSEDISIEEYHRLIKLELGTELADLAKIINKQQAKIDAQKKIIESKQNAVTFKVLLGSYTSQDTNTKKHYYSWNKDETKHLEDISNLSKLCQLIVNGPTVAFAEPPSSYPYDVYGFQGLTQTICDSHGVAPTFDNMSRLRDLAARTVHGSSYDAELLKLATLNAELETIQNQYTKKLEKLKAINSSIDKIKKDLRIAVFLSLYEHCITKKILPETSLFEWAAKNELSWQKSDTVDLLAAINRVLLPLNMTIALDGDKVIITDIAAVDSSASVDLSVPSAPPAEIKSEEVQPFARAGCGTDTAAANPSSLDDLSASRSLAPAREPEEVQPLAHTSCGKSAHITTTRSAQLFTPSELPGETDPSGSEADSFLLLQRQHALAEKELANQAETARLATWAAQLKAQEEALAKEKAAFAAQKQAFLAKQRLALLTLEASVLGSGSAEVAGASRSTVSVNLPEALAVTTNGDATELSS